MTASPIIHGVASLLPPDDPAAATIDEVVVLESPASGLNSRSMTGATVVGAAPSGTASPPAEPPSAMVSSCAAPTPVWLSAPGSPRPGVGSKLTQPKPSNHTSGQAWAWRSNTWYSPSSRSSPGVKPMATRAGMPSERAIAAKVADELLAVPAADAQELADRVVAVAGLHGQVVGELGPEPVLQGDHLVVRVRRPRR